jgi:hypothetical protein
VDSLNFWSINKHTETNFKQTNKCSHKSPRQYKKKKNNSPRLRDRLPPGKYKKKTTIPPGCVIACLQGRSRSCSIATGYLIKRGGFNFFEATDLIREKRPRASPNMGFTLYLRKLEPDASKDSTQSRGSGKSGGNQTSGGKTWFESPKATANLIFIYFRRWFCRKTPLTLENIFSRILYWVSKAELKSCVY